MDIAIQYERINLGYDRFLFKPICVIKGKYDEDTDSFETEHGILCSPILSDDIYCDNYFNDITTIEELKKYYGNKLTDEELLTEYLDINMDRCFIGYFDELQGKINAISIQFSEIESMFLEDQVAQEDSNENHIEFTFDIEKLKELRNTETLEEVRSKLDEIIAFTTAIEDEVQKQIAEKNPQKLALKKEESKEFSLKKLKKNVLSKIINQDEAVNAVTTAIAVNATSKNPAHKSHIMVIGPSGTGKTKMISIISKELGIPFFEADATAYTQEGYVGKSVNSMLEGLISAADGDIEVAQNGILIIDEIDKKLADSNSSGGDVAGKAVLHSLLKTMDRGIVEVDIGGAYSNKKVMFDTANLTIVFMGAFEELYKKKAMSKKLLIGFGNDFETKQDNDITITNQDLIDYGMPAEFLGRIPTLAFTNSFKEKDFLKVLYESKISQLRIEEEYFKDLGINVKFTYGFSKEIAKKAEKSGTGVRALNKLIHESLINVYDDVLTSKKPKVLKISKQTALDNTKYYIK